MTKYEEVNGLCDSPEHFQLLIEPYEPYDEEEAVKNMVELKIMKELMVHKDNYYAKSHKDQETINIEIGNEVVKMLDEVEKRIES